MVSKTLIGLTGMPGSGKSVVSDLARDLGIPVVAMGDVVREEVIQRGLSLNPKNVGEVMMKIRTDFGQAVIAERCLSRIRVLSSPIVLVEGIRSIEEADLFRKSFPRFQLIAVHSSPQTRLGRLRRRGRSDDSRSQETFDERDRRELRVGIGSVIALADRLFVNEGNLDSFKDELRTYLLEVISCAGSRSQSDSAA